uniref:cyclic di-3',5'-guanylate-activated glycosyltransferase NfrB n=2 Tax=Escherichia coli TaxID=562 RepID=UPI000B7E4AD7
RIVLTGHPQANLNREWQVVASELHGEQPQAVPGRQGAGTALENHFAVIPADRTWRPQPLLKPLVDGPQSAVVTGPAGEEIFCDEHGRVRVKFNWDRYNPADQDSSCWIRVAQAWAGTGFGHLAIPRVGQEVIVDFLNGDPDQPIIMGRTYHQENLAITLAVIMFISGLDDFFIDVVYWVRRIKRKLSVYRRYPRMSYRELYKPDEKPLAIMVPAWNETGVIGNMAELAATTLDYENYHIFVGTYPNDPDTQRDVDEVCARFPNVHKVVCARPGPTSKADCLNNVLDAITQFERSANFAFAGFILHDAEDVISPMELRLFNYLVERKDLIQIPVYPFEREWTHFTSMTYIDEFSELHGKDVPVREALAGQVPSAGVGTCFSRRAVTALLADGDGIAFDVQSLTEDYDIGFRLKEKGMTEIFVRFPVVDEAKEREQRKFLQHARTSNMICVREYFPDTFSTAVRQKSRWIIGIVFQGFKTHKWTSSLTLNYFLWRDRKGAISNFVSFLAMLVMLQLLLLLAYESLWPNAWHFLSIFSGSAWLMTLLWLNFGLMVNRIVQRVIFVTGYYGLTQGLLSVLRLFWGNLINFMANWRALKQVLQHGDPRRVAWDKTTHDFPSVTGDTRSLRPLGQILLENQVITEEQLDTALRNRVEGLRLGGSMLMQGLISAEQLAQALAEQNGVAWESIDAWQIPSSLIAEMPASVALHYAVLPLRLENDELIVGSEDGIDPVSLAALTRKVGRKVRYVIVLRGQIVTGLRHWYARRRGHDPRAMLYNAVQHQWLTEQQTGEIWRQYVPHQFLFAEILTTLGHINRSAINVLLLRHERSSLPLGKFLVTEGVISQETLDRVLTIQRELQVSMQSLLLKAGLNTEQVAQLESENEGE